ncbi:branched-chain amino acid ABC transporter permease [Limnochorda pilosa]|uniref:Branched-chain amino acid transport system permease protein LivM n=1 Tax=Limnochorda pilosa TaxID=1555112 RepID=A0A0K2SG42_LIMPI|nr:branched-chain amino acid ABC transporter permease [Limnochorda pilosa]BAS26060.1 branched-chain amino acid transport system permease protein LivM [Limnochorda pilosa]
MELSGLIAYLVFFISIAGIYALLSLGLNVQWGYTGLFNIGVAGFFAVGAYTSAILTTGPSPNHLGGFGWPVVLALPVSGLLAGLAAYLIGLPTLRLKEDYLAIASIGIAETLRLVLKNEAWLTNGVRGIPGIPRPLAGLVPGRYDAWVFAAGVVAVVAISYLLVERGIRSPWGRVLRAIREDDAVAAAVGKDVFRHRMEALVLGSTIMGVAGALYASFTKFISPDAFMPWNATFLVWVGLILGGSGNNRGAVLGAVLLWAIWSGSDALADALPAALSARAAALRMVLIGVLLEVVLLWRPQGVLGEERQVSRLALEPGPSGLPARSAPARSHNSRHSRQV